MNRCESEVFFGGARLGLILLQERVFVCPVCTKAFSEKGNMTRHIRTVHKTVSLYGVNVVASGHDEALPLCRRTSCSVRSSRLIMLRGRSRQSTRTPPQQQQQQQLPPPPPPPPPPLWV